MSFTGQGDHFHPLRPRGLNGLNHVAGVARRGDTEQHIACAANGFNVAGEHILIAKIIAHAGEVADVGDSGNVIKAIEAARAQGMKVITLTGKDGGKMAGSADVEIRVPHFGYADRIQEIHIKALIWISWMRSA